MLVDVNSLNSHPHKKLFKHVDGVIANTLKLTEGFKVSKWAEITAIFHDLGKINPNFQDKLFARPKADSYGNHAYFSAFAFFCAFAKPQSRSALAKWLGLEKLNFNDLIALTVIIAKHHGHLLDLCPEKDGPNNTILNQEECKSLFKFIEKSHSKLPIDEFADHYLKRIGLEISPFSEYLLNEKIQNVFIEKMIFKSEDSSAPLDFFLKNQFAFASLIYADKSDAADFPTIEKSKKDIADFCKIYPLELDAYLEKLIPNSRLNELRTAIRKEAVSNIEKHLKTGKRVFELTSPTGSGKTLMLMSLASKIIEEKGDYRMIYALPFLSITEQVEAEVFKIFTKDEHRKFIQRVDSKSENPRFENIQKQLDDNPSKKIIKELGALTFQESVFAYPLIITTFVRFFETLLSNRNAALLKLPNFSKCIFLLDEIQSLPPRLYTFFIAYLDRFCEKFDSYAVISTATQPNFNLPSKPRKTAELAKTFFPEYKKPQALLDFEKYYADDIFNRYKVQFLKGEFSINSLAKSVLEENESALVILNTIDDSKDFYQKLKETLSKDEILLLNTHFNPNDRKKKIKIIKDRLKEEKRIIAVSTQLIEAGVDIDFPLLYRDFAPVSSIVQSAGRCNRNGKLNFGTVKLFKLRNRKKIRSELIYGRGKDRDILQFTKDTWKKDVYSENELLAVQKEFFNRILDDLHFAKHTQKKYDLKLDFIQDISECMFQKIGNFRLIDEEDFGEQVRYYVAEHPSDNNFEKLLNFKMEMEVLFLEPKKDWSKISPIKLKLEELLRKMSNNIVQVRIRKKDFKPEVNSEEYYGLYEIAPEYYSFEEGVDLTNSVGLI